MSEPAANLIADPSDAEPQGRAEQLSWRRRWAYRLIILLSTLLVFAAAYGLIGDGEWVAVDSPLRYLRVYAETGGWYFTYVSIPEDFDIPFPSDTTEATRDFVQDKVDRARVTWDILRADVRRVYVMSCDWAEQRAKLSGRSAYFDDMGGGAQTVSVGDASWQMPVAFVAAFPAWWLFVPAVLLLIPLMVAITSYRRRMRRQRYCRACDYDLTGNHSGICPECGTPLSPDMTPPDAE
ncbi:MAG: hypothetical protein H6817_07970 [Phycisphaerales bacterium]|nr:hypothetical protein [Phycisphaerales bacterium]